LKSVISRVPIRLSPFGEFDTMGVWRWIVALIVGTLGGFLRFKGYLQRA